MKFRVAFFYSLLGENILVNYLWQSFNVKVRLRLVFPQNLSLVHCCSLNGLGMFQVLYKEEKNLIDI